MTAVQKIKTDEQVRKRKRKRPETEHIKSKKKQLAELKDNVLEVKLKDKQQEDSWSKINIEDEKSLMSMGLASLEVMDESEFLVQRPGKRKKKSAPKDEGESSSEPKGVKKKQKKNSPDPSENEKCNRTGSQKLTFAQKKDKLKQKRKEKMRLVKLRRLENPDSEKNKLRLEKLKAKRKAKRKRKAEEKQLKSEIDSFVSEKQDFDEKGPCEIEQETIILDKDENTAESANIPIEKEIVTEETTESKEMTEPVESLRSDSEVPEAIETEDLPEQKVILSSEEKEAGEAWLRLDVCEPIVKGLLELGFHSPTEIQQACIPSGLLKYKDVIGAAETGSGKTLAFGIPLVQRVMRLKSDGCIKGLVLCPTRELALQVTDHLKAACKHTGVRIVPIVGGIAAPKQERLLSYKPPILVATPGRLWQLIQEHPYLQDLTTIKFLVIDEADRMVADGHFEEVSQIVARLPGPEKRNAFLFSATLAFTIDRLEEKAKKKKKTKSEKRAERKGNAGIELLVRNVGVKEKVEKVDFTKKKGTADALTETYFMCNVEDKDLHLYYMLLTHPGKTLVFVNSIDGVMNLVHILKLLGLPVYPLHSSLQQRQRFKFLEKFAHSQSAVLICTDIAARGLDIPEVDSVIHYQLPSTKEAYIHRSGRTARADNTGLSVAVVGPKDFKSYKKIAKQVTEFPIENGRLRVLRPPLELARQIFKIERLHTRPEKKKAKLLALAKEAGLTENETENETTSNDLKRNVKEMKARLKVLLEQPVIDPLNSARYATTKGSLDCFQTLNSFTLGISALEHANSKKKG